MSWSVLLRCERGHHFLVDNVLVNVEGHAVVPLPDRCWTCFPPVSSNRLSGFEQWRWGRRLKKQLRDV